MDGFVPCCDRWSHGPARRATLSLVLLAAASAWLIGVATADAVVWSGHADNNLSTTVDLSDVSCPSAALCVGVGDQGRILSTTNPAAGAATWSAVEVETGHPPPDDFITGISCPSPSLCVAVDVSGNVISSPNPTGSADVWKVVEVAPSPAIAGFTDISCPTVSLCVAVGIGGFDRTYISTDPTGGAAAWQELDLPDDEFSSVDCASSSLCVAATRGGRVWTSTDPTGGAGAWSSANLSAVLRGVSCPSASLCVVVGYTNAGGTTESRVYTSTNPVGGAGAWGVRNVAAPFLSGVSCSSVAFCVGVGDGAAVVSNNPTGGAAAWSVDSGVNGRSVSCPTASLCAAVGSGLDTFANPAGGAPAWDRSTIGDRLTAISCPSSLCVATMQDGRLASGTWEDPAGTGFVFRWDATRLGFASLEDVSCPSASFCAGVDANGNVVRSANPGGGAGTWSAVDIGGPAQLRGISCPTAAFCAAVDNRGKVLTTSAPGGGAGAWTAAQIDGSNVLNAISCPSASFCAAVDEAGNVLTSTNPAGGPGAWQSADIDANSLTTISCPSASLCVAGDDGGILLASANPAGRAGAWQAAPMAGAIAINDVSCPIASLCLAVDQSGFVRESTNPPGGAPTWTATRLPSGGTGPFALDAVGCTPTIWCVAQNYVDESFSAWAGHQLTVAVAGDGSGAVAVSGGDDCSATCSYASYNNEARTLTAEAGNRLAFRRMGRVSDRAGGWKMRDHGRTRRHGDRNVHEGPAAAAHAQRLEDRWRLRCGDELAGRDRLRRRLLACLRRGHPREPDGGSGARLRVCRLVRWRMRRQHDLRGRHGLGSGRRGQVHPARAGHADHEGEDPEGEAQGEVQVRGHRRRHRVRVRARPQAPEPEVQRL